jgi:tRNA-specific 2-thiouridylase
MKSKGPVVVGLSGGVDSALAAWLIKQEGWDVIGVFLHQWDAPEAVARRCCSQADGFDARALADELDIPFIILDAKEPFRSEVVEPFVQGYLGGTTPNPCVICNERVKLRFLVAKADELGAEMVVTGHYSRLIHDESGRRVRLFRGVDPSKDQSYFLFRLPQEILRRLRFPLGEMTKEQVRRLAHAAGLSVASKPDSQQLCFLGAMGVGEFIERHVPDSKEASGDIIGPEGKALGRDSGAYRFTVGQRRGLGVYSTEPLYV